MGKLFARLELFDEDGFTMPGYVEIDVRQLQASFSDTMTNHPTIKLIQPETKDKN